MARYLVLLLLALNSLSILAYGIGPIGVSIDCGESDTYIDENSISWVGDDKYIQNGESMVVESNIMLPQAWRTLRVFTSRRKNCYSIDVEKGAKILVRASFYYGNYDNKSSPPIFDLHFDGNYWGTIATTIDTLVFHEAIYVAKQNTTSVCVAQIFPTMFPFISAIEVRSLSMNMYKDVGKNYGLILRRRVSFGTKEIVRYPVDEYDRIWIPANNTAGFTEATSYALITANLEDNPPAAVIRNAFIALNTSFSISLRTNLPSIEVPIYMNMYFSEVSQLDSTQERSFQLYMNELPVLDIKPQYGKVTEASLTNLTASANTSFLLFATSTSTLPPLINALEVFTISDELTDGTSRDDVEGLASLKEKFEILQDWNGDPCLPTPFKWEWVNCSTGATPRVTALYLSDFDLLGPLPDFSSMDALEIIDLQNNSLNGEIPDFLGNFPNLRQLNLADNDFSGPVPTSLSKNTELNLVVTGNPDLCVSGKSCQTTDTNSDDSPTSSSSRSKRRKNNKLPIILGATIPIVLIFVAGLGVLVILHHQRKSAAVAAATTAGGTKIGNGPNNTPQGGIMNLQMVGNVGPTVMNQSMGMGNIQNQTAMEAENQTHHHQAHEDHHDTTHT